MVRIRGGGGGGGGCSVDDIKRTSSSDGITRVLHSFNQLTNRWKLSDTTSAFSVELF